MHAETTGAGASAKGLGCACAWHSTDVHHAPDTATRFVKEMKRTASLIVATSEVHAHVLAIIKQVVLAPGDPVPWPLNVATSLRLEEEQRVAKQRIVRPGKG